MAHPTLFVALKAFIERDGKVLILREAGSYADGTRIGKFDLPGGRLHPGENYHDGLIREVKEETGLDVAFGEPFCMDEWRPTVRGEEWHIVATFVRCHSQSGEIILGPDHDAYEWIYPEQHHVFELSEAVHKSFQSYLKRKF